MNEKYLLDILISPAHFATALSVVFYVQFQISYIFRNNKFRKEQWEKYALSNGSSMYTRDWMAVDKRTRKLCGGRSPISFREGLSRGLIPKRILEGKSMNGQRKCSFFNLSFEDDN